MLVLLVLLCAIGTLLGEMVDRRNKKHYEEEQSYLEMTSRDTVSRNGDIHTNNGDVPRKVQVLPRLAVGSRNGHVTSVQEGHENAAFDDDTRNNGVAVMTEIPTILQVLSLPNNVINIKHNNNFP